MDTLAHALLGVTIGVVAQHVGAADVGGAASATGQALFWGSVVATQVPDLDLVTMLKNRLNHIKHHHGLTHSLAGAVVQAGLVAGGAALWFPGAAFGTLFLWMFLAIMGGHIVPDWLTAFGTRLLLPFRNDYFALDWLSQTEPVMSALLLFGAIGAFQDPARAPLWAGAGLAAAALFVLWRGYNHRHICLQIRRAYAADHNVLRVAAQPHPWGLTRYEYTVDTPGLCRLGSAWLGGSIREQMQVPRPDLAPYWNAVAEDRLVAGILRFTRNPVIRARSLEQGGWVFEVSDFRGGCAFHFSITADQHLQVRAAHRASPEPQTESA